LSNEFFKQGLKNHIRVSLGVLALSSTVTLDACSFEAGMPQKTPMCYFRRPRQSSTVALEARKSEIGVLTAENYINGYF